MKLLYRLALRLTVVLVPLLVLWAALFYYATVDEIHDEADDSLEAYSYMIMTRHLAGETLPPLNNGSNNSYQLRQVDSLYAATHPHLQFRDDNYYIPDKREYEPARVLTTLFRTPDGRWMELEVATPTFEKDDLLETILGWIVFLYVVLLISGVSLTMWVIRSSMKPFYRLLQWVDRYTPGHAHEPVPNATSVAEFRQLSGAMQQMVDRSEELYDRQKQFIGNASHELQTPLAVLGNRMEWMLDTMELNEAQMAEVVRMLQTQRHLVRLNRNLLLLTKIDNGQFPESVAVDLVQLIRNEQEILDELYEEQQIRCTLQLPERFEVQMNESLASVLITNLLRNAYLHSAAGAAVEASLGQRRLVVKNEGAEPLDAARIFERFYQGSKREGSTGLGLALVRAVCEAYGLRLTYQYGEGYHHFEVEWPA